MGPNPTHRRDVCGSVSVEVVPAGPRATIGVMPPATGPALIILVVFLLPGFVTVLLQEKTFKRADDPTPLDRLLRIIWYSVCSYLLVALVALAAGVRRANGVHFYHEHTGNPGLIVLFAVGLLIATSLIILLATLLWNVTGLRTWPFDLLHLNARHIEPTAWDFFFRQRRHTYVRIKLASGDEVAGYYGANSFAAYARDGRDVFLERACEWDGEWFGERKDETVGVWVNTGDAVMVEFYNPGTDAEATDQPTIEVGVGGEEGRPQRAETAGEDSAAAETTAAEGSSGQGEVKDR